MTRPLVWGIFHRISDEDLARYRTMAVREDDNMDATVALGRCVDEIQRLYADAVAEVSIDSLVPKVEDLADLYGFAYQTRTVSLLAKRLDPSDRAAAWIGARAKSIHTVMGKTKEEVVAHLDKVVGR